MNITVKEAADRIGKSVVIVYRRIEKIGITPGREERNGNNVIVLTSDEFQKIKNYDAQIGRPRKV